MTTAWGIKTVLHPVSDLETAKAVYTAPIGIPPQTGDAYVGFRGRGPANRARAGRWTAEMTMGVGVR